MRQARRTVENPHQLGVCNLCEAICGLELTLDGRPRSPASAATPPTRSPAATSAPRASPSPTSTPTPTGCAARCAGRRRAGRRVGGDRLGRGVRPGRRRARRRDQRARRATRSAIYLGNPNVHSLGSMTHGAAMVKSLAHPQPVQRHLGRPAPHQLVAHLMYGHQLLLPIPDIDRTSYFLVFGANPMASNGSLMTVPDFPNRLRDLKARGGRMVVFDPRRTETAKVATEHHFVRPGTDAFVLLAMLHVLLRRGPGPAAGVRRRAGRGRGRGRASSPPSAPRQVSGVPADEIRRIAREFAAADGGGGVRPDRRLDPGVRHGVPVGDQAAQPPDRQPRPGRRRDVHRTGDRRGRHRR